MKKSVFKIKIYLMMQMKPHADNLSKSPSG